jgi:hypothetical protein
MRDREIVGSFIASQRAPASALTEELLYPDTSELAAAATFSRRPPQLRSSVPNAPTAVPIFPTILPNFPNALPKVKATVPIFRRTVPNFPAIFPNFSVALPIFPKAFPNFPTTFPNFSPAERIYNGLFPSHLGIDANEPSNNWTFFNCGGKHCAPPDHSQFSSPQLTTKN